MTPEVMTLEQVAEYLQLPPSLVLRKVRHGEIPAAKIGRCWRVRKTTIDEWLDEEAQMSPQSLDRLMALTGEAARKAGINTLEDMDRLIAEVRAERESQGKR